MSEVGVRDAGRATRSIASVDPRLAMYAITALLALAVAAPSLFNGFAYDDRWIIETNNRVHSLGRWGEWFTTSYWPTREASLYRPLTTASFAVQWVIGRGAPWVFHAGNIALYIGGCLAFARLASLVLPLAAALIVAALFAVHPVHVEAVANVVGQAELSAGLIMFASLALYIRARRDGSIASRVPRLTLALLMLLAVFIKEHAIVMPAWFLAAELTLFRTEDARGRIRVLAPLYVTLALIALMALAVRWQVIGAIGGDIPHPALLSLTAWQRAHVMLGVLPDLARLLVWPAKLYADYSPAHVLVSPTSDPSQINGLLILFGTCFIVAVAWKRRPVAAFGILLAVLVWLPTANIVFPSGILLAERTLFLPSGGVLIAAGVGFAWLIETLQSRRAFLTAAGAALGVLLVLGIARSVTRSLVWKSSDRVFFAMVRDQPLSFRAHYSWGGVLFDRGDVLGGVREWQMAIRIFPGYHKLYQDLAGRYLQARQCGRAIPLFRKAMELGGALPLSRGGLVACQLQIAHFSEARRESRLGILDGNDPAWFRARLFTADSALSANDSLPRPRR